MEPLSDISQLAAAIADQPQLFDCPDYQAVRAARDYGSTGTWTIKNSEKLFRIVAAWLNTGSFRKTADLAGVSRNTVTAVLRLLEQAGKLEPLKERFARARLEAGMDQLGWLRDVIETRDLEAAAVVLKAGWIGVGIVSDKEAAAPPAPLHLHLHGDGGAAAGPDPVLEYERLLRQARRLPVVDVESDVQLANSLEARASSDPATPMDTPSPTPCPPVSSGQGPAEAALPAAAPEADPRGGGCASTGGGIRMDGTPQREF